MSGIEPIESLLPGPNLIAPTGTSMPFNQSAPPPGWVTNANAALTDCLMRTVTGAGGGTGGSIGWSGWNFGGTFSVNAFTLSVAQLPAHSHSVNDPGHGVTVNGSTGFFFSGGSPYHAPNNTLGLNHTNNVDAAGANVGVGATGSGAAIQPSYTTPQVKYSDYIMGVKS